VRIFVATLRKLVRRPASFVTLGLLIALVALIFLAVGATADRIASSGRPGAENPLLLLTFPATYGFLLSFIIGLGGLFAVIYGATVGGSEWGWGTLKNAVARGESRSRYVVLTVAGVALLLGVGLLIAFALGILVAIVGATLAGVSTSGLGDGATLGRLPEQLARGWLAIVEEGAVGFAVATIARSQLAGIGVGIAFYFGETFAGIFLPDIVRWLPFDAASAMVNAGSSSGFGGGGGGRVPLAPDLALVVVLAWLLGSVLVAALFTERAEISG
jgi:ABC-type transport system involved in multi-copper enzyme maturation permease subunit